MSMTSTKASSIGSSVRTSVLARLLATENLRIAHDPTIPTAAFDGKTRTLYLPQWRVDKQTYDFLVGHEVAHAIYTNSAKWESAVNRIGRTEQQRAVISDFINVVEDARIDRLIKRDYPGLRADYKHGYSVLHETLNIFKKKGVAITLKDRFIDRINLHYKVGIHAGVSVPFTDDERKILDRINTLHDGEKDFDRMLAIAEELYLAEKQEHEDQQEGSMGSKQQSKGKQSKGKQSKGKEQSKGEEGDQDGSSGSDGSEGDQDGSSGSEGAEGNEEKGTETSSDYRYGNPDGNDEQGEDQKSNESQGEYNPEMVDTASSGRKGLSDLVDSTTVEQQIELRPIDVSKVVVEVDEFVSLFNTSVRVKDMNTVSMENPTSAMISKIEEECMRVFKEVSDANRKSIDLMCRRFETRRSARNFAKTGSQKTGRISCRLLNKYKFSEDIFDRMVIKPDEKNHGIVILLDWSGSMQGILSACISQLVATVLFCRRVGIPVEVYFFTSIYSKPVVDAAKKFKPSLNRSMIAENERLGGWGHGVQGWTVDSSREAFNEAVCRTTKQEITDGKSACYNPFSLVKVYQSGCGQRKMVSTLGRLILLGEMQVSSCRTMSMDCTLALGGTPLDESIIAMRQIVNNFRKSSNTKVTLISMTDGEGMSVLNQTGTMAHGSRKVAKVMVDKETGRRFEYEGRADSHRAAVQMFKDGTGARIVGVRLEDNLRPYGKAKGVELHARCSPYLQYIQSVPAFQGSYKGSINLAGKEKEMKDGIKFVEDNFLALEVPGYDGYCLVNILRGKDEDKKIKDLEKKADMSKGSERVRRNATEAAFLAKMKSNQANRLFINTLMDIVAK